MNTHTPIPIFFNIAFCYNCFVTYLFFCPFLYLFMDRSFHQDITGILNVRGQIRTHNVPLLFYWQTDTTMQLVKRSVEDILT